jgi:hypothetical protein
MNRTFTPRRLALILVICSLVGYGLYRYTLSLGTDHREQNYDFAYTDTAAVDRIVIWDKTPDTVVLTREKSGWKVNGAYAARPDAVEVILETLHRMALRNFPQKSALPAIVEAMSTYGKEVTVYANGEEVKHFYVGTETPDMLGTYMMLHGADQPYAVYIPGFNGYLSSRFFTREDLWRDRTVFGVDHREVREVRMRYFDSTAASVALTRGSDGSYAVYPLLANGSKGAPLANPRDLSVQAAFAAFRTLMYEGMIIPTDKIFSKQDSLRKSQPAFELYLRSKDQDWTLTAYHVPGDPEAVPYEGAPASRFDPDRFYAFLSDGRFVLIQRHGFQSALFSLRSFR